jgi:hypothetical protein
MCWLPVVRTHFEPHNRDKRQSLTLGLYRLCDELSERQDITRDLTDQPRLFTSGTYTTSVDSNRVVPSNLKGEDK